MTHSVKHIAGKPFKAGVIQDGREKWLGRFVTAAEAALAVARFFGPSAVTLPDPPAPEPMTAAEVQAAVEAEGLTLMRSGSNSGYKNV